MNNVPRGHVLMRKKMKQNKSKTNKEWCLDLYEKFILTFEVNFQATFPMP